MWQVLGKAQTVQDHPVVIIGHTIMGKGVDFMEEDGRQLKSTWHGIAPSPEQAEKALQQLQLSPEEKLLLDEFRAKLIAWTPPRPNYIPLLTQDQQVKGGEPIVYAAGTSTDCRSAYGKALLDLAQNNPQVVALAADLRGSVKTEEMGKKFPERHIEVGIAEQNMVSIAGGLSLSGFVPFASTFGAFMTSRAKDQARVNDINVTNVKMVATHCGLSVGEDGPTHQAIDDLGSFLGFYNTMLIEPVDANHTDRIIRYIATHYGNFYVRMGRHKFPVLLKEDGSVFYDADYQYQYGRTEVVREGNEVTIVAVGACVGEAVLAWEKLEGKAEVVAVSSIKQFDQTLVDSIAKTGRVITVEDHNPVCGLAAQVSRLIVEKGIKVEKFISLGVPEYQFSGTNAELYRAVGIDAAGIGEAVKKMLIV
jgi:transketolase